MSVIEYEYAGTGGYRSFRKTSIAWYYGIPSSS